MLICKICGCKNHKKSYYTKTKYLNTVYYVTKCPECGNYNVNPNPKLDDIEKMYRIDYHEKYYLIDEKYMEKELDSVGFVKNYINR